MQQKHQPGAAGSKKRTHNQVTGYQTEEAIDNLMNSKRRKYEQPLAVYTGSKAVLQASKQRVEVSGKSKSAL